MAVTYTIALAAVALACHGDAEQLASVTQHDCAACKDPETTDDESYVSIGVMPSPYPIDWSTPNKMYGTTIATSAVAAIFQRFAPKKPVHSIGHALLKVRCGSNKEVYISQTGALEDPKDPNKQLKQLQTERMNMLFATYSDGYLYNDGDAKKDWQGSIDVQNELENGTYESDVSGVAAKIVKELPADVSADEKTALETFLKNLPRETRHRFVRATIRITREQCDAILAWRDAYDKNGEAPARYGLHRAPWVMDDKGNYDGGACGTVSFAGAFYATGLDYKAAATRLGRRLEIGTARLVQPLVRDNRKVDGWYALQDDKRYAPGSIPCAKNGKECKANGKPWFDKLYDAWSGPDDEDDTFSNAWETGNAVKSKTVPLVAIEPEMFYQEILKLVNNLDYKAFAHGPWCKVDPKIARKVPVFVLDGTKGVPRKEGIKGGFSKKEVKLF
jgi:hypothetical protein